MTRLAAPLVFCMLLLTAGTAQAWENYALRTMTAYVQSIEPGNVIMVNAHDRSDNDNFPIRFYGIGLPTLSQPFGSEARTAVEELLPRGAKILISTVNPDEQGILNALVQRNDHSINNMLIDRGLAWVDRSTCKAFFLQALAYSGKPRSARKTWCLVA